MKVVAMVSAKGGCGRTTLTVNLAVNALRRGLRVQIFDLDPSTSASQWGDFRRAETPKVISLPAQRLDKALASASRERVELIIIDGAPNAPEATLEACEVADLILVPTRPGIVDIRVNRRSAKIAKVSGKSAWAVINQARVGSPHMIADAQSALAEVGFDIVPRVVHQRAVFSHCMVEGLSAQEYEPGGAAAAEIAALCSWVLDQVRLDATAPVRRKVPAHA